MRDNQFRRIKVTNDDNRGFEWIGPAPTENMIQDIQNQVNEISRKYMQEYLAKSKPTKKPTLEFVFDPKDEKPKENPVDLNSEKINEFKNLFQKYFGIKL
jgi:hypothetical protein